MSRSRPPSPLIEPKNPPARHSRLRLPPYRHVPGLTPHPVRHPEGHQYGADEPAASPECANLPEQWRECEDYLYGIDLFNRAYLWEAHEAWEAVWIAVGKEGEPAAFVQGLIQVAAALLRLHLETPGGARNLMARAQRNLSEVEPGLLLRGRDRYMGVSVGAWLPLVERYLEHPGAAYPYLVVEPAEVS